VNFTGSIDFWVGLSLHNPEKTADKFAGSLTFGWVRPFKILRKLRKNPSFEKKLGEPVPQTPKKLQKNPSFEIFLGEPAPLKLAGNRSKIQILKPVHHGKKAEKSKFRNLFLVPCQKFPNWQTLTSFLFLLTSASK
jgi:hypothetical protein